MQQANIQLKKSLHLHGSVHFTDYQIIDAKGLFHLAPENRKPCYEPFDGDRAVELELRLDPSLLPLAGDSLEASVKALDEAWLDRPLRQTENWYALNVKQEIFPGLKVGYSTTWAEEDK